MTDHDRSLELLKHRLQRVHARGRVADTILGVALDALEPYASEYLTAADYQRLCEMVDGPVRAASDEALATLLDRLADAVAEGDPEFAARLEGLRDRATLAVD